MRNTSWTNQRLADAIARTLGDCETHGFTRLLLHDIGARILNEALEDDSCPETLDELWQVIVAQCAREGEAARLLQVCLHEAASRQPGMSVRDYAEQRERDPLQQTG